MSEQQIRDGFEQLEGALAPPLDATSRVDRLVRVRRRRRRTGLAVGAVAGVAALGAVVLVGLGGDGGGGTPVAVDPPPAGLVLERPDGTTVRFDDVEVSCSPPMVQGDNRPIDKPRPGTIWAASPIELAGPLGEEEPDLVQPFVMIEGKVAQLQDQPTLELPIDGPGDSTSYPMTLFVADTVGGTADDPGNEAASSAGGSGTVRVLEASCDPVPVLRLEVDAVLGSEEGKQDLGLVGELR